MLQYAIHSYVPQRFLDWKCVDNYDREIHRYILEFKDGFRSAIRRAAEEVSLLLSAKDRSDIVFVCIPASNKRANDRRYKAFSEQVCNACGAINGFEHIHISGHRPKLHNSITHTISEKHNGMVVLDADFFYGKKVLLFDDITTTNGTARSFKEMMESTGAKVIGCLFLAKTRNMFGD